MKSLERAGKWGIDRLIGWRWGGAAEGRAPSAKPNASAVKFVLVVRPHNQMGDMLLSTPLFRALRRGYPGSRTTLVASPDNAEIMLEHPDVDEVLVFDKKRFQRHSGEAYAFLRSLRAHPWDLVIMPTTVSFSVTSAIVARLAGGRLRVGSDGSAYGRTIGRRVFQIQVPCRWAREHQSDRNLDFARALDLDIPDRSPSMGLSAEETSWARTQLADVRSAGRRAIGIHPGAGKRLNRWPAERFARVAAALAEDAKNQVFVIAGPKEGILRDAVRKRVDDRVVCLADLPLRRAAALIGGLDLLICNDTGVMHIGAALGRPTLALFGPTDPGLWAPLATNLKWLRAGDGRMETLTFDEVHAKALELLRTARAAGEATHASDSASR